MVVITYTWRHCADLTMGSPGPPGFLIVCFHPTQTLPLQTEATALRHLITDQWPPLPLSQQLPNASEPQNRPSPLPYPSSIFINGNRQQSPRVQNLSFRMIFKEGGERCMCANGTSMAKANYLQMCPDQPHTHQFVRLLSLKFMALRSGVSIQSCDQGSFPLYGVGTLAHNYKLVLFTCVRLSEISNF